MSGNQIVAWALVSTLPHASRATLHRVTNPT